MLRARPSQPTKGTGVLPLLTYCLMVFFGLGYAEIDRIIAVLRNPNPGVSCFARDMLRELGPRAELAIPRLITALSDQNANVKADAAFALRDLGKPAGAATPTLTECLKDKDSLVRYAAASALGEIGEGAKSAVKELTSLLRDKDIETRIQAAHALLKIARDPASIPVLRSALSAGSWVNRLSAVFALGESGSAGKACIPDLVLLLDDSETGIRVRAAEAIWKIDGNVYGIPTLVKVFEDSTDLSRFSAAHVLWSIDKHPDVLPMLRKELYYGDSTERILAAVTLRSIGPEARSALPDLEHATRDSDEIVVQAAEQAIARIKGEKKK